MLTTSKKKKTSVKKKGRNKRKKNVNSLMKAITQVKKRLSNDNLTATEDQIKSALKLTAKTSKTSSSIIKYNIGKAVSQLENYGKVTVKKHKNYGTISGSIVNIHAKKVSKKSFTVDLPMFSSKAGQKRKIDIISKIDGYLKHLSPDITQDRLKVNLTEFSETVTKKKNEWYRTDFYKIVKAVYNLIINRLTPESLKQWINDFKTSDKTILQVLVNIINDVNEDDKAIFVQVLHDATTFNKYSKITDLEDRKELLSGIINSLTKINFTFSKHKKLVEKLIQNIKALDATVYWVLQNNFESSDSVWEYIKDLYMKPIASQKYF